MRKMAGDTGGQYYSVSDANSLAEVYREIETLEKSHVGTRDFVDYEEPHLFFLAPGALLLFIEISLAATVFRRSPCASRSLTPSSGRSSARHSGSPLPRSRGWCCGSGRWRRWAGAAGRCPPPTR